MLLDEDPASLIANCIANFNIAPDKSSLKRTHTALTQLTRTRDTQLARARTTLAQRTRDAAAAAHAHGLAAAAHDGGARHAAEMLRLDAQRFAIAREAREGEIESERVAEELRRVMEEVRALEGGEGGGAAGDGNAAGGGAAAGDGDGTADEMVLRLKVYRMLGIDVEPDAETGIYSRAVIRNREKGDARVVNIDPKFSRYFYADYFWNSL